MFLQRIHTHFSHALKKEPLARWQENSPGVAASDVGECCEACQATIGCNFYTFVEDDQFCYLKSTDDGWGALCGF